MTVAVINLVVSFLQSPNLDRDDFKSANYFSTEHTFPSKEL